MDPSPEPAVDAGADAPADPGPLTPEARRKPEVRGITVKLADGNDWVVRRPRVLWVDDDTEDGYTFSFDLGPEYQALADSLEAAGDFKAQTRAFFAVCRYLLGVNYRLGRRDFAALLRLDFTRPAEGEEETDPQRIARELQEVINGTIPPPKAPPGGSG